MDPGRARLRPVDHVGQLLAKLDAKDRDLLDGKPVHRVVFHEITRGVAVTGLSRRADGLDVADQPSVTRAMGRLDGVFDLVVVATGILAPEGGAPEKSLSAIDAAAMARVMAVNAIGPALILREVPRLLPRDGRSVVAVLTARVLLAALLAA